jgi:dipeptidyl aminopeptidase/acylaminoacyl peptidase
VAVGAAAGARGGVTLGADRRGGAGTPAIAPNGRMAWVQSQALAPEEVWIAERAGLAGSATTTLNAAVAKLSLGETRTLRWASTDGRRVEGLVLRPPGAAPRARLKTLVLLHGGPYGSRYSLAFHATAQYFAAHGYQVFMPNFRASGGYGTAFMLRERSDWGGQDWRDVMTGIDSLVAAGLADGDRLGVFGHSYGGYLSAWAITQTDRFDAACVSAGAVDLVSHYGQSDIHKYRAYEFGGHPWQTPENWARSSPSTHIRKARTPTLILAGEEDRRVPYPQGRQLYTALTALEVPTEFVHYPREPHTLREYRHRADWHARILRWFDRWIR